MIGPIFYLSKDETYGMGVTTLGAGQKDHLSSAEAKCPFGPLACHMSCCPWDTSEHILSLRLRYPSWHPDN